jgi:hypothetical protein
MMTYQDWLAEFKTVVRSHRDGAAQLKQLDRLLRRTRAAARTGVTDWQEGEVLGFRASSLEDAGNLRAATRAYLKLADVYRGYFVQYGHALAAALEAAAATDLRIGNRGTARRVSDEVLRLRAQFPDYGSSLAAMLQALHEDQLQLGRKAQKGARARKRRRTKR